MTTYDLTTFGEGQIRLTVPHGDRLKTARHLRMTAACSEANVAALLSQLGHRCAWGSVVPQGELGDRILGEYRSAGLDSPHVVRTEGGRVALYFLEPGDPPMPGTVTYDRLGTPFRDVSIDQFDWETMMDTRCLLVTGITTALTTQTADLIRHAVAEAAARDVPVVLDVNYRSRLWSPEEARATLEPMFPHVALLLCSRADARVIFGIGGTGEEVSSQLRKLADVPIVISTDQTSGVYYADAETTRTYPVRTVPVVDRPGAGDAFVAGTIHGYLEGDVHHGIECGIRTATFALTHHGDITYISAAELVPPETADIVR